MYNGNIFMLRFQHYIKYKSHAVVRSFVVNMTCTSFLICIVHCSCIEHAAHISRHIWTVCIAHVLSMLLTSLDIFRWCQHLISSHPLQYCHTVSFSGNSIENQTLHPRNLFEHCHCLTVAKWRCICLLLCL